MDGIGRNLAPRPMAPCAEGSDPLTGLWPTLLFAAPLAPPLWQLSRNPLRLFLVRSDCQCCIRGAYYLIQVR
jgi:hypothetical protein